MPTYRATVAVAVSITTALPLAEALVSEVAGQVVGWDSPLASPPAEVAS